MSKFGLVIVMLLMAGRINAQNYPAPTSDPPTYFVLIQADDEQAFYIRLDSQLRSSSPQGHLILARLMDSAYTITVGFPGQIYPEQRYLLNIGHKDRAFHLRRQDNRWGLIDDQGQTMPVVADPAAAEMPLLAGSKKDDAFSQMMAAIVRDTAVMYNTYAAASDSAPAPVVTDTPAVSMKSTLVDSSFLSASTAVPSAPTGVVKLSEHKSTQSLSLVYTDHPIDKKIDTIDVVIPIDTQAAVIRSPDSQSDTAHLITHPKSPDITRPNATHHYPYTDTSRGSNSVIYITHLDSNHYTIRTDDYITVERMPKPISDTARSGAIASVHSLKSDTLRSGSPSPGPLAPRPSSPGKLPRSDTSAASHKPNLPFINSDCHAFATDYDVDKLRIRMLTANKDDDRILVANKVFKIKCFSTNQVSALCAVFATDAAKFKFLEAAYPFVSDDHFPELVNLLSDPVYAGKFRALTGRP
jgi:Domain of unknown function (DUF4476)